MAFEGDLRELEFGDVVQTLSMTRQHGTLVIHGAEPRRIAFTDRGLALLSAQRSHGERVGRYLVGTGRISSDAYEVAIRGSRRDGGGAVGDALLNAQAVSPEDLKEARRYVAEVDLFELFRLRQGRFEFLNDDLQLTGPFASMWFDVGSTAMEAARRIDETPRLDEIVPLGEVLTHADPAAAPAPGESREDIVRLYGLADGTRTVGDVVAEHHLGAFDTRKALGALYDAGAVRPATAVEILTVVDDIADAARAAKLLRRAVQLEPADADAWQKLAKALAASGSKSDAAVALCELASLQYADGNGESSLSTLRTALKLHRQSPAAHAMLTRILLALELFDDAVESARDGVTECLAAESPQVALDIALAALQHAPDDTRLLRGAAAAHAALGQNAEAVAILDPLAHELFKQRGREKELVEVYRSILSLAPDRADVQENMVAVREREALRRRRRRHVIAAAAALALVASIAVPAVFGTNVQERLDRMNELIAENRLDEVQVLLNELRDENIEEALLKEAVEALQRRVDDAQRPTLDNTIPTALIARTEAVYARSREQLAEHDLAAGLATLLEALPELESDDFKTVKEARPETAKRIRDDFDDEVKTALAETESACLELGAWATQSLDELQGSPALKRAEFTTEPEDFEELQRLAELAAEVETRYGASDWVALKETVPTVIEAMRTKPHEVGEKIATAVDNLVSSLEQGRAIGERAVAHVHRLRLLTEFRDAKNEGADLVAEGKLEDAAVLHRTYLAFCAEVRDADRGEVYSQIVRGYMETFQLEDLIREQLTSLESILGRERAASDALYQGDVNTAFAMRVGLVREFPHVGFSARFELPLRIESRPPGAEILLRDEEGERPLGRTTSIVEYPAVGDSQIVVRLEGFEEVVLQRHGAFDDADGEELIELMKRPLWSSEPGAATEAAPVVWKDRVIVADRDGVVRALALSDGREVGRLETGMLGGFAGTPAVRDDLLYLAGVDGVGFLVDPSSMEIVRRFQLPGAVRSSLIATGRGVVIVDERGTVHLVDERGADVWRREVGSVVVDPVATSDRVLLVTLDGQLVVLSLSDGTERRRTRVPGQPRWSAPTVFGNHALVACESGTFAALDLASGSVAWSVEAGVRLSGRPAMVDGVAAVPTTEGTVLLRREPQDGDPEPVLDTTPVGPIGDGVAAVGGGFVATGRTGVVRRLDRDGELIWRFDAGDAIGARATRSADRVLIVTRAGRVFALED